MRTTKTAEPAIDGIELDRSDWELVTFGDVAVKQNTSVDRENTELTRYVAGEHMGSEDLHLREWGELGEDYLGPAFTRKFSEGDILYGSRRTYLRKVAVAHFDGITANTTFVIKPNEERIIKELLPFVMLSEGFAQHSIRNSKGSVNPYINWKDIANYEFLLPPKDQQAKLAKLVWAADGLIESQMSALQKVENLTQSYRSEIFSRSTWPRKKLKELFSVQLGKMLSPKAKQGVNPFPYLANANVQWDSFDLGKMNEMDFSEKDQEKFSLRYGDLLVCEGGDVGRSAVWRNEITPCFYQKALHRLRPLTELSSEVMLQFMIWAKTAGVFTGHTGHSTIAHLTAVMLKELNVPVPPSDEIPKIEGQFAQFKNSVQSCNEALSQSRNVQKSLINQIF